MPQQSRRDAVARERKRRRRNDAPPSRHAPAPAVATRRAAAATCGWCGGGIEIKATGRIPKWCSAACRQRAWEQSRAAASGRSAVEVVERVVEVSVASQRTPQSAQWATLLRELAQQLVTGRVYTRDLPELSNALTAALDAFQRQSGTRRRHR